MYSCMSIEQALTKTVGLNAQSFIEKAIEGGWGKDAFYRGEVTHCKTENGKIYLEWFSGETESLHLHEEAKERILLDPLAWKAVGKVEGWGTSIKYVATSLSKEELLRAMVNLDEKTIETVLRMEDEPRWLHEMHRMIDALAEGKIM